MNEEIIKEIKALYSSRSRNNAPVATTPEVNKTKTTIYNKSDKNTFFINVLNKLGKK